MNVIEIAVLIWAVSYNIILIPFRHVRASLEKGELRCGKRIGYHARNYTLQMIRRVPFDSSDEIRFDSVRRIARSELDSFVHAQRARMHARMSWCCAWECLRKLLIDYRKIVSPTSSKIPLLLRFSLPV